MTVQNKGGCPKLLTREKVIEIIKYRLIEGAACTRDGFAQLLVEAGIMPRRIAGSTLYKIFAGEMYSDLVDPDTGSSFDYDAIAGFKVGRPSTFARAYDPENNNELFPRYSKAKMQYQRFVMSQTMTAVENMVLMQIGELRAEIQTLKQRVHAPENK